MDKLTGADVAELSGWFAEPDPPPKSGRLGAQTYEPRSEGVYDPTQDLRLERLVEAAMSRRPSDTERVGRTLAVLGAEPGGRGHVEVLRRAFGPLPARAVSTEQYDYPEVALVTWALVANAIDLARDDEHLRRLDLVKRCARLTGAPLESVCRDAVTLSDDMVRTAARKLLERTVTRKPSEADLALRVAVKLEMVELVDAAGDAYRRVRAECGATRRAERAEQRRVSAEALDALLGRKREREAARFSERMRRAS